MCTHTAAREPCTQPSRCSQIRAAGDKDADDIRTLMEEVDLRIGEAKKSTYEFKRDVVMAGDAAAGASISADRVVRCGGARRRCAHAPLGA